MTAPFGSLKTMLAAALVAFTPPADCKPSEWAAQSVYIPEGNAVPGLIDFSNAPYQVEPLDMTADPACERITLMWGGQVGKTTMALCAQAFRIDHAPTSQLMMQPSEGDLGVWLETKFNPLVAANKTLAGKLSKPRGRTGANNTRLKTYSGGQIMFSWAGSPRTMRQRSAPFVVCDETDGYDRTKEGHPVNLLWQRAATFGDQRLLLEISTPSIKGFSWIEKSFLEGDQRRFHVCCPHCGHSQTLKWGQVQWEQDAEGVHLPETAYYLCDSGNGCVIEDAERVAAIRAPSARWIAAKPFRGHASYHINELYSCFRTLRDVVQSFLEKKAANDVQTFVNVSLAETWEEEAEQVTEAEILRRVEKYPAEVPAGVAVLTAGVDMQEDRLECETVGWGLGEESWSVDYQVFYGDPNEPDVWEELFDHLQNRRYRHEHGAEMKITAAAVDTGGSGGLTRSAYNQLRGKQRSKIFAVKGVTGWNRPVVGPPGKGKVAKERAIKVFPVAVDDAKLVIMRRLKLSSGPGTCHFPDDRHPEYFAQFTAERLVERMIRGFPFREWHKTRERNEALDCRVYAYAALVIDKPNLAHRLARLQPSDDDPAAEAAPAPKVSKRRRPAADAGNPPEDAPAASGKTRPKWGRKRRRRNSGW